MIILLAVVPRVVVLDRKPLMHDESLFGFYAYTYMQSGQYTHIPMLHGPTLMLAAGKLFKIFGDTIGVGRMFVAIISIFGMAAGVLLWPRRYRWWLAPLLFSSPILLYYSRFFRDDMIISTAYLLATLGAARAFSSGARGAATFGGCLVDFLLFFRWPLWKAPSFSKPPASPSLSSGWLTVICGAGPARVCDSRRANPGAPTPCWRIVSPTGRRAASGARKYTRIRHSLRWSARRRRKRFPWPARRRMKRSSPRRPLPPPASSILSIAAGWAIGILAGICFVMFVYSITYNPQAPYTAEIGQSYAATPAWLQPLARPLLNLRASWEYWVGQHKEQRITGEIHYHLPILVTYELPILLFLFAGLAWDAVKRRRRALFYAIFVIGWSMFWIWWRATSYKTFWDFDTADQSAYTAAAVAPDHELPARGAPTPRCWCWA